MPNYLARAQGREDLRRLCGSTVFPKNILNSYGETGKSFIVFEGVNQLEVIL